MCKIEHILPVIPNNQQRLNIAIAFKKCCLCSGAINSWSKEETLQWSNIKCLFSRLILAYGEKEVKVCSYAQMNWLNKELQKHIMKLNNALSLS